MVEYFMKKIILRLYKNGKKIRQYRDNKITKRIFNLLSLKLYDKAYVRVNYGTKEDVNGKRVMFYNDATTEDKKELVNLIKVFWREE
jgi:hypothetical protein